MENKYIDTKVVSFSGLSATEKAAILRDGLDLDSAMLCTFLVATDKKKIHTFPPLPFEHVEMALALQRLINVMYDLGYIAGQSDAIQETLPDSKNLPQQELSPQPLRRAE